MIAPKADAVYQRGVDERLIISSAQEVHVKALYCKVLGEFSSKFECAAEVFFMPCLAGDKDGFFGAQTEHQEREE